MSEAQAMAPLSVGGPAQCRQPRDLGLLLSHPLLGMTNYLLDVVLSALCTSSDLM